MKTAQPIRDRKQIEVLKMYLRNKSKRDFMLLTLLLNTNLRVSDAIDLQVKDLMDGKKVREHLCLTEKKTKKYKLVRINDSLTSALTEYVKSEKPEANDFLIRGYCQIRKALRIGRLQVNFGIMDACELSKPPSKPCIWSGV